MQWRMRAQVIVGAVFALGVILTAPPGARACSCVGPHLERRVAPTDGAIGFPTNGTLRIFLSGFPPAARPLVGAEYRLRDAHGALVPLDVSVVGTRVDLRPRSALAPSSTYTLDQVFAFDAAGLRLSDTDRLQAQGSIRGAFYPVVSFTTGVASASRSLVPRITSSELHVAYGGGDCGPATRVALEVSLGAATRPTDILELEHAQRGAIASQLASSTSLYAGDMLCDPNPVSLPDGPVVVRAVLRDASGAVLGVSPWASPTASGLQSVFGLRPRPSSAGRVGVFGSMGWPSVTMVPSTQPLSRGPTDCTNGLEVIARHTVVAGGAPWMYADRPPLDGDRSGRWLLLGGIHESDPMRLFAIGDTGAASSLSQSLGGYAVGLIATPRGPLVAYNTYTPDIHSHTHISLLDARGAPLWSRDVADDMRHERVIRGGGNVLVAWSSSRLSYQLLQEQDGTSIASVETTYTVDTNSEAPAAAWVDGRALLVWASGAGTRSLVSATITGTSISAVNDLSAIGTYSPPDLAAAGAQAGLATATNDGHVFFTLLDHDGLVAHPPVLVSAGMGRDNRLPRVAWNGRFFALAWEKHPSPGVFVAAVDGSGNVSPALRIDAGEDEAGTVGMLATATGWLAVYTAGDSHDQRIAELRCAPHQPLGAPQSIGP